MAIRATRRVADHHHSVLKQTEADDPRFTLVLPQVFRLEGWAGKDDDGLFEVELNVATATIRRKLCWMGFSGA